MLVLLQKDLKHVLFTFECVILITKANNNNFKFFTVSTNIKPQKIVLLNFTHYINFSTLCVLGVWSALNIVLYFQLFKERGFVKYFVKAP